MLSFLADLLTTGTVTVPRAASKDAPSADLLSALNEIDMTMRRDLPHTAPVFSPSTALWALEIIENACRFLVYREIGAGEIAIALKVPCLVERSASRTYSADLFLRFLPDVFRLAKGIGPGDPLVEQLQNIAGQWPLSSVGIPDLTCDTKELATILNDPSLRQLYVDRVIEKSDTARLTSAEIRRDVRSALGNDTSLAPDFRKAIDQYQEQL